MTKGDAIVERGAAFLEELSQKAAAEGGFAAKLAEPLADDAVFLRKLKPSLVAARLRGEEPPEDATLWRPPAPPPTTAAERASNGGSNRSGSGPKAFAVVGAAFAVGIVVAKFVDWRGHAHPRD
jgi:hypothetical protein